MRDSRFEWDDRKAKVNFRKHGVTFDKAARSFQDPFAIEDADHREYGETRANLLGMCDGTVLRVTFTERGEQIRIISARQAEQHEQDDYDRENSV